VVWTSPSGHRWWVRSPELEPPPWERDPDPDPDTADTQLADLRATPADGAAHSAEAA
jgi:hypothetical protein